MPDVTRGLCKSADELLIKAESEQVVCKGVRRETRSERGHDVERWDCGRC